MSGKTLPLYTEQRLKALMEQQAAARVEHARAEARRRIRLLLAEMEKNLPADVPLHERGFGVMDEPP